VAAEVVAQQVESVDGVAIRFGEPFGFDDGLSVHVGIPEEFAPSPHAVRGAESSFVKFPVRLVNESGRRVRPASVTVTVTSGKGQGGSVIDEKQALIGPPRGAVEPGDEVSWMQGFGVLDPNDVAVVVQVGVDRAPVAFTS
jgi:hypothetical protein